MKKIYVRKKLPKGKLCRFELFSFKAVAASAMRSGAIASATHVDFAERTIIARAVVLTFGYSATDCIVDVFVVFVHHIFNPP